MITYTQGNLLEADVDALVNTVNCVGVMGKGIALQFRQAFPECFADYKRACDAKAVRPGKMHVHETGAVVGPKYIINFPTKRHWKGRSKPEDVEAGLEALRKELSRLGVGSVALPPLGCGNGGLDWGLVRRMIERKLNDLAEVDVRVFEPAGSPDVKTMTVATKTPNMTRGRAALLAIFRQYLQPGYELSLLEIQKLAYFLQVSGEPLRLAFEKGKYGPYAETLHHVLQRIEGHFIRGYGDRNRQASVDVVPQAMERAENTLAESYPDTLRRAERVKSVIEGFETPYGLELLSSVHWIMSEDSEARESFPKALSGVRAWNRRKEEIFPDKHLAVAWERLHSFGDLNQPFEGT